MKSLHHLFKSVIVINYSTNPDGYTYDSVKEIAVESKFKFADYGKFLEVPTFLTTSRNYRYWRPLWHRRVNHQDACSERSQ